MSKAPSMPMYWDAYLADTTHLTTEEHGAYLLLLAAMWRRDGSVPNDDRDNARILGLTKAKWVKIKKRLEPFLIITDDEISQKNLRKNWEKTQEKIGKNRENGSKGGRPKSSENKALAKANGSNSQKPNETIPEPEPEPLDDKDKSSSSGDVVFSDENFSNLLRAVGFNPDGHIPQTWRQDGMDRVNEWLALGLSPDRIISTAKASASRFSDLPATPQALSKAMDLEAARPAEPPKPTHEQILQKQAEMINGDGFCPASFISPLRARELIELKLVSPEQMKKRGIAA